jgi:hypothetical protein
MEWKLMMMAHKNFKPALLSKAFPFFNFGLLAARPWSEVSQSIIQTYGWFYWKNGRETVTLWRCAE